MDAEQVLQTWLEQERQLRAVFEQASPKPLSAQQAASMTGLQLMQALLRGEFAPPSISKTLDFLLIEVGEGRCAFQGAPGPAFLNPMGGIHGGWYATLLDSALGCAVHTLMPAGRAYTTAELNVNLVRALGNKAPRVRAQGQVLHCGRQLATAEARLVGPDGTLYAHATTTCLVFDLPPPKDAART